MELGTLVPVAARVFGVLVGLPIGDGLQLLPRLFIAVCFAAAMSPGLTLEPSRSMFALAPEFIVGFIISVPARCMAEAAAMFGELVDTTRGQTLGSIVDPLNGQQVSDLASIARLGAIAMVLSVGGIEAALTVVHASYEVCPSAGVILKEQVLTEIVSRVISLAGVALYLASVWLVSFAVVDLGCALMAKVAQGLSFSSCASILKLLATVLLLLHVITSSNSFRARIGRVLWEFHLAAVDRPATGELDG